MFPSRFRSASRARSRIPFRSWTACLAGLLLVALATVPSPSRVVASPQGEGVAGYYRFPALHGQTIVFAAEGDLWRTTAAGGLAQRLTTHAEEETDAVISPDGRTVAFTARYEGPAEVYTMPITGGAPVRRTYESESSIATAWTPDGRLVYQTTHYATLPVPQLVIVDLSDGTREVVPLSTASEATYDGSGRTLYFVRPAFHNNVTRRYTGGTARDVWRFGPGMAEAVELTGDYEGESHSPMWWEGRVYFVTDRDGTMNIWSMTETGSDVRQHTRHSGWDVKWPDLSDGRIAYNLGADLWLYDIASDRTARVPITLASDFDQLREKWEDDPLQNLTSVHLHPKGESVALTARGRVFVAPVGSGRLVRASRKDGVRFRDVTFMPDGEQLLGLSDETGELEFVTLPVNGIGLDAPLTDDGEVLRFQGHSSPDGSRIAYTDNNNRLWLLEVASGRQQVISLNEEGAGDMAWSPDSRWLAYSMNAMNSFRQIQIYDTQEGTTVPVTSDRVNSSSAAWDAQGDFLYFLSDRNLRSVVSSPWGTRQPEPYFDRPMEIFQVALRAGLRSPFRPDDELYEEPAREEREQGEGPTPVRIDIEGLMARVDQVPVSSGNYSSLTAGRDALYWLSRGESGTSLMALRIGNEDPEPVEVATGVRDYELSADRSRMLIRQGNNLAVVAARPQRAADLADNRVDLSGWAFPIDVREDWRQIFIDAWRLERDYFYDPGMHGVDWEGVRDKYLPLVDRVTTRDELSDLIGRVVGELSALHTSVRGGDLRQDPDNISVAALGARLFKDPGAGGYRIDYIYRSDPDYPDERSPLADPYLAIEVGDIIETVNGISTLESFDLGELLRNQAGEQVLLGLRSGRGGDRRQVIVEPLGSESNLRYSDWEYTRRLEVEEKSEGQIGYVHLRAMGGGNLTEWYRNFYPVFDRPGLIVDVRRNSGGNIDSFILEKLMRRAWMYWKDRAGQPTWNMHYAFRGHMVVLVDQNTASDGEAFAEGFRRLGLGPVIGMRTWGGEIWLSSSNRLSDGGLARAPMTGVYGPEGIWLIEQIGVIPDIEVDNLPHATFNGSDAQLEAAVAYLLQRIAEDPREVPAPPAYPDRGFRYPPPGSGTGGRNLPQPGTGSGGR
ncbi:S41 family peptidase [Gemmatimonadota bacterium]